MFAQQQLQQITNGIDHQPTNQLQPPPSTTSTVPPLTTTTDTAV